MMEYHLAHLTSAPDLLSKGHAFHRSSVWFSDSIDPKDSCMRPRLCSAAMEALVSLDIVYELYP